MGKISETLERTAGRVPGFLKLLKELEPLILLSSLAIIIAGVTASVSQRAAGYAVGAGMMFLAATISVILERAVAPWPASSFPLVLRFAVVAFVGFGILLLLAVVGELSGALPGFSTYAALGTALFVVITCLWYTDTNLANYHMAKQKLHPRLLLAVTYGLIIVGFDESAVSSVMWLLFPLLLGVFLPFIAMGFIFLVAGGVIASVLVKRAKAAAKNG